MSQGFGAGGFMADFVDFNSIDRFATLMISAKEGIFSIANPIFGSHLPRKLCLDLSVFHLLFDYAETYGSGHTAEGPTEYGFLLAIGILLLAAIHNHSTSTFTSIVLNFKINYAPKSMVIRRSGTHEFPLFFQRYHHRHRHSGRCLAELKSFPTTLAAHSHCIVPASFLCSTRTQMRLSNKVARSLIRLRGGILVQSG